MTREIMEPDEQTPENQTPETKEAPPATTPTNEFEQLVRTTLAQNEQSRLAAERRVRELEDELAKSRTQQVQQTQQSVPDDQAFYQNPVDTINKLIQAQIGPLNQFTQQFQQQTAYANLKNQYRAQYPAFVQIESLVDQMMQGLEPSHANMQIAIQRAVGHLALTNPAALTQVNTPAPQAPAPQPTPQNNVPSQAHLRPSNNPPAAKEKENKRRPLSENERRIIREMGINEDQYFELMEKPIQVDSWKKEKAK